MLTIEGICEGTELNKRFYMPGVVLRSVCPKCQIPYEKDMAEEYLSYPVVGKPKKITGYCEHCEHEWDLGSVIVRVSLEIVPEK